MTNQKNLTFFLTIYFSNYLIQNIKNIRQIKKLDFFLTIYFSNYLIENIKNI